MSKWHCHCAHIPACMNGQKTHFFQKWISRNCGPLSQTIWVILWAGSNQHDMIVKQLCPVENQLLTTTMAAYSLMYSCVRSCCFLLIASSTHSQLG